MESKLQKGFTLLEISIAMTISSILVILVFSSIQLSTSAWISGNDKSDHIDETLSAWHFLYESLKNTKHIKNDRGIPVFHGTRSSIRFVSYLRDGPISPDLYVISITTESNTNGIIRVSLQSLNDYIDGKNITPQQQSTLFLTSEILSIGYYGSKKNHQLPQWFSSWEEQAKLPLLVSINISSSHGYDWPTLTTFLMESSIQYEGTEITLESVLDAG